MTTTATGSALSAAADGRTLSPAQAMALAECDDLGRLAAVAEELCLAGHGVRVTFSKKEIGRAHV